MMFITQNLAIIESDIYNFTSIDLYGSINSMFTANALINKGIYTDYWPYKLIGGK